MSKRALITGVTGQDGSYLAELLLNKGYEVYGLVRRVSTDNRFHRIEHLMANSHLHILHGSLTDLGSLQSAMDESRPDEVYNLAAQSDVWESFKCEMETVEINYYGVGRVIDAALAINPHVRIYQASTSEMFGNALPPQNEHTPFAPESPYGRAKTKAHKDFVLGRRRDGAFTCSGFLFNHESPRRGINFVTRKITNTLARISLGDPTCLELGNLDARRDWGYAPEYVEVMWMMLQRSEPEDFVIATGENHTVREFVNAAASALKTPLFWNGEGLSEVARNEQGRVVIQINPKFYRPNEVNFLWGDSQKARFMLGWKPQVKCDELASIMALSDLKTLTKK